jgi:hypothetical protein
MKFLIGALSLAVILALVGTPALLLFGWGYLTVSDRQAISRTIKTSGAAGYGRETRPDGVSGRAWTPG